MAQASETRIERDSMGEVDVPAESYWGAQTQRSLENFRIGGERMPAPLRRALAIEKKAAALNEEGVRYYQAGSSEISARWRRFRSARPPRSTRAAPMHAQNATRIGRP